MNDSRRPWSDMLANGRTADPCTPDEQAAGKVLAKERQEV
jgi:hypothetical protein